MKTDTLLTWVKNYSDLIEKFHTVELDHTSIILKRKTISTNDRYIEFIYNLSEWDLTVQNSDDLILHNEIISPEDVTKNWQKWLSYVSLSACLDIIKSPSI